MHTENNDDYPEQILIAKIDKDKVISTAITGAARVNQTITSNENKI